MKIRQMIRKSVLAVVTGILLLQTTVFADVDTLGISQIIQKGNDVYLYVNTLDSAGNPAVDGVSTEQFSVSINKGASIPVQDAAVYQTLNEGISYIFCIDVSGSVTAAEMEEIRSSISAFVNGMGPNDYAKIVTIGSEITAACDSTQDRNALNAAIQGVANNAKFTYLYEGISYALNGQRKSVDTMPKRAALVLFTDGMDDSDGASGETQVLADIAETRIPIYVVGLKGNDSKANLNSVGNIARQSGGSVFSYSDMSITEAVQAIGSRMQNSCQLHVVPESSYFGEKDLEWKVQYVSGGYSVTSSTYIYSLGMEDVVVATPTVEATATPSPKPTVAPLPSPTPIPEKTALKIVTEFLEENLIICVASGLVLIALIIIVISLIQRSRRRRAAFESEEIDYGGDSGQSDDNGGGWEKTIAEVQEENEETVAEMDYYSYDDEATVDDRNSGGTRIAFEITFDGRTETVQKTLVDQLILGRGNECDVDVVLRSPLEERKQTSRKHAYVLNRPDGLYIKDNSKNKTYLNGVEVMGEMALRNEDILQLGKASVKVIILSY